jgi:hypothetical protein
MGRRGRNALLGGDRKRRKSEERDRLDMNKVTPVSELVIHYYFTGCIKDSLTTIDI